MVVNLPLPSPAKHLRIGVVARELGLSSSMIRAWERLGMRRAPTAAGAHRLYAEEDVQLLRRAIHLRKVDGLNAPAILDQLRREGLLPHSTGATLASSAHSTGSHLRALRLERHQSLAQVAAAVGVSVGFLSNLERSQTGVSLGIMHRLAHHYGTSLSEFFRQADSPGPLIRKGQGRALAGGDGVQMELLAWGKIVMEPHLFHIAPGKGSSDFYSHYGEEFLFIIKGKLKIMLGDEQFHLSSGDSFYFNSNLRHSWVNPGKTRTTVLWTNVASTASSWKGSPQQSPIPLENRPPK